MVSRAVRFSALSLFVAAHAGIAAPCASAASSPPITPLQGSLKGQVDGLVRAGRGIEDKTAKEAAVYLVALVHCHRAYDKNDGPVIREPLKILFANRRPDGLIGGDAAESSEEDLRETTAWAWQALESLDARGHTADLEAIKTAFGHHFKLAGAKLDAALHPFGTDGTLQAPSSVRDVFKNLIEAVATQQAEKARKSAPEQQAKAWKPFMQKGLDWLLAQQSEPGVWSMPGRDGKVQPEPGVTALALAALAGKPAATRSAKETESLTKGIEWLLAQQKAHEDGAFSDQVPNYVTSAAVLAISRARGIDVDAKEIAQSLAKAQKYLLMIQNIERNGYMPSDRDYGSVGYGGAQRGDLSNTQMALDALRATGLDASDDAFAKALIYLRRVQNLPGQGSWSGKGTNDKGDKVDIVPGDDGGATYYPGVSYAGYDETADGGFVPRSYGSMTYALLKCYVIAGIDRNDPRIGKALDWCFKNFTLDINPGVKASLGENVQYQGLFYYYLALSRALSIAGVDKIPAKAEADAGLDWRTALETKLEALQQDDGSWVNAKNSRWWENSPMLCTAYALLALSE